MRSTTKPGDRKKTAFRTLAWDVLVELFTAKPAVKMKGSVEAVSRAAFQHEELLRQEQEEAAAKRLDGTSMVAPLS